MRNSIGLLLLVGALSLSTSAVGKNTFQSYRVVGISDGDTLTALSANRQRLKCRLYGIDAPEKRQAFGEASKVSLSNLSYGQDAMIDIVGRDRYGRAICRIAVAGVDVNKAQITRGMAWMYRQYAKDRSYSDAEAGAQSRRIGIWRDAQPVPPWDFRRKGRRKS